MTKKLTIFPGCEFSETLEVFREEGGDAAGLTKDRQIAATRQQLAKARQDQQRYKELVSDGAAPTKMPGDATLLYFSPSGTNQGDSRVFCT